MQELWKVSDVETWAVVLTGMAVVFAVLIALVLILIIMGKLFSHLLGKSKANQQTTLPDSDVAELEEEEPEFEVGSQNNDEIIAAISAAISTFLAAQGNAKPFVIKSVKRVREARPAWNTAGILENTRPF